MNIICYYQTRPSNQKGRWDVFIYFKTSYVTTKRSCSLSPFFCPFQNILCYYQTLPMQCALTRGSNFKTSYVTTKPTVLSHFSAHQFTRNRSTAGFYLNFTNRRSIFIMIPENASFPCKIRLFSMFTKIPVGKPLL